MGKRLIKYKIFLQWDSIGRYHSHMCGKGILNDTAESICVSVHFIQMSSYGTEDVNRLKTLVRPTPHYLACVEILLKLLERDMESEIRSNSNMVAYSAFQHIVGC